MVSSLHRRVGMVEGWYLDENNAASGRIARTSAFDALFRKKVSKDRV